MFDGVMPDAHIVFVNGVLWPSFRQLITPHITKIAEATNGKYLPGDFETLIEAGEAHAWVIMREEKVLAVITSTIIDYPRKRALMLTGVVGHRPRLWMHFAFHKIEQVAKEHFGCDIIQALHQPKHIKLLTTGGWTTHHHLSSKDL